MEIRQLVGVDALSKGKYQLYINLQLLTVTTVGIASFKLINEMRRKAVIDENGFMVPEEDQKQSFVPNQVPNQVGYNKLDK